MSADDLGRLPALMPLDQAAAFLRMSLHDIHDAIEVGDLPVVRRPGVVLVDTTQLLVDLGIDLRSLPLFDTILEETR